MIETTSSVHQMRAFEAVQRGLGRVQERFDRQLATDIPPLADLCRHVERYRGKMLRPTLALACGLAAHKSAAAEGSSCEMDSRITPDLVTVAAVVEMVHMATLVHDDVLDEADTRRQGRTVNRLHGNEAAVMLGDYLIAASYHLCSQLDQQAFALRVGHASMTMCAGELLQLHHRENLSLDEPTYFEIIRRKTGALVALSARLGAEAVGASEKVAAALERFGMGLGVAFQIQDDLLDLTGDANRLGKPVGKDLEKGKLTLPVIHHLAHATPMERGKTLELLRSSGASDRSVGGGDLGAAGTTRGASSEGSFAASLHGLRQQLESTGSLEHAKQAASRLAMQSADELRVLPASGPRELLAKMTQAVVERER